MFKKTFFKMFEKDPWWTYWQNSVTCFLLRSSFSLAAAAVNLDSLAYDHTLMLCGLKKANNSLLLLRRTTTTPFSCKCYNKVIPEYLMSNVWHGPLVAMHPSSYETTFSAFHRGWAGKYPKTFTSITFGLGDSVIKVMSVCRKASVV